MPLKEGGKAMLKILYKIKVVLITLLIILLTSTLIVMLIPEGTLRTILCALSGALIGNIGSSFLFEEW